MNRWASNWRERVLLTLGVPMTNHAMEVLSAWQQSTPIEPWTNNPLGMPAHGNNVPTALNTPYASFPTFTAFLTALNRALSSGVGAQVKAGLASPDTMAELWRAIHSLEWPANRTETDHPSAILDKVESEYREGLQTTDPSDRRTSGVAMQRRSPAEAIDRTAFHMGMAAAQLNALGKAQTLRRNGR